MKKILLTMAALAAFSFANAYTVELNMNDVADDVLTGGEWTEETKKEDGSIQNAKNYQPVGSFKLGDYTFSCTKTDEKASNPAFYYATSTNANQDKTLRMYKNNTLTITAPAGIIFSKIEFKGSKGSATGYTADKGSFTSASGSAQTWSYNEGTNSVTITYANNFRIQSLVFYIGAGQGDPEPEPAKEYVCKMVTDIADGDYSLCIPGHGAVSPVAASSSYGYLMVVPTTFTDNSYTTSEANIFTFKHEVSGYTIKDSNNRYLGMDASHYSIQMYDNVDAEGANCYWLVSFAGNGAIIENAGRTNCKFYCMEYKSQNTWEISVGDRTIDGTTYFLPQLYRVDLEAGIQDVELNDADAPVEFFNLQGVRVAEPSNGLYIKRQGKTVTKVLVK